MAAINKTARCRCLPKAFLQYIPDPRREGRGSFSSFLPTLHFQERRNPSHPIPAIPILLTQHNFFPFQVSVLVAKSEQTGMQLGDTVTGRGHHGIMARARVVKTTIVAQRIKWSNGSPCLIHVSVTHQAIS